MKKTPLKRVSKKRKYELQIYCSLATYYLKQHPYCEMLTCCKPATQIHHKKGRTGNLLNDTRYWMAICQPCHDWIHTHGKKARAIGLLS